MPLWKLKVTFFLDVVKNKDHTLIKMDSKGLNKSKKKKTVNIQ